MRKKYGKRFKSNRVKSNKDKQVNPESYSEKIVRPKFNTVKSKVRGISLFVGALILGIGVPEMIGGNLYSPFLIAVGLFLASLVIITDDDVRNWVASIVRSMWVRVAIYVGICFLLTFGSFVLSYRYSKAQEEIRAKTPVFYGELTPSNKPTPVFPPLPISPETILSPDTFVVMLGDGNGFFINGKVNNTFYLGKFPFLKVTTREDGAVLFSSQILDSSNHKVITIIDNEFQANPDYAFKPRQPDKHSLIVRDSEGVEVLNIKYINSQVLWITGKFFSPRNSQTVSISPDGEIDTGELSLQGIYATVDSGGEIFLGEPPDEIKQMIEGTNK